MKIVFAGTSDFASTVLEYLENVSLVLTKADAQSGRGMELTPSPVKKLAIEKGFPVITPEKIDSQTIEQLRALNPDVLVVVAYGLILPKELINLPKYGCFNIHGSILPNHRGASPISASLLNLEKIGGITIIKMDESMDTGDIVRTAPYPMVKNKTLPEIHLELARIGGIMIKSFLEDLAKKEYYSAHQQNNLFSSYCFKFGGKNSFIDFNNSAEKIHNKLIALSSWTNFKIKLKDFELIVKKTLCNSDSHNLQNGEVIECSKNNLKIACAEGILDIISVQAPGKKAISWKEFFAGNQKKLI